MAGTGICSCFLHDTVLRLAGHMPTWIAMHVHCQLYVMALACIHHAAGRDLPEACSLQGKVVQALRCAQQHQLKSVNPEMFLSKAAETGEQSCVVL